MLIFDKLTPGSHVHLPAPTPVRLHACAVLRALTPCCSVPLAIFLVQVFLTLLITRLMGKVVSYARQPRVIGEIIGGL
jgi:hypothetical protein